MQPLTLSINQKRIHKYRCEKSHVDFTRKYFKHRTDGKFIVAPHHKIIAKTLQRVVDGEITRLIINIPPRFTKTEMAVIAWIARCMAVEPRCKFVHLSYSKALALSNSSAVKEIIGLPEYQELWPLAFKADANAKERWNTDKHGGVYATSTTGQVTGFGAGLMEEGFYGALVIDDPVKPDDVRSQLKRTTINERYNNTIASRKALKTTPIIVIMQRVHDNDLSGYLLRGGSAEKWHHLELPALINNNRSYPRDWTHGVPIEHGLPDGPLWPYKHDAEDIETLKQAHSFTYAAQYDQRPKKVQGKVFDESWWKYYDPEAMPTFDYVGIYADTAQKVNNWNDFSVLQAWGYKNGEIYLIDQIRDRWEAPTLKNKTRQFVDKFYNPSATYSKLRHLKIEDKVSGTGLIQELSTGNQHTGELPLPIPVLPLTPGDRDKLSRAMDAAPFIQAGRVHLPNRSKWLIDYVEEFNHFSADDSHDFDDQVDPTLYAIQDMLSSSKRAGVF